MVKKTRNRTEIHEKPRTKAASLRKKWSNDVHLKQGLPVDRFTFRLRRRVPTFFTIVNPKL
eukprot:m.128790 g.128790  ORF g.128790 m.128790 type:complete len:61 (+) comp13638_c0_seq2:1208-1390(+)